MARHLGIILSVLTLAGRGAATSWAVAPGLTFVTSESDDDDEGSLEDFIAEVTTFGVEIPVIVTHRFNDVFSITGVVRYSLDSVSITFPSGSPLEDIGETAFLHRLGAIGAPSLDLGVFYLRPEIGVELAGRIHGDLGYVPIIGLGAGFWRKLNPDPPSVHAWLSPGSGRSTIVAPLMNTVPVASDQGATRAS